MRPPLHPIPRELERVINQDPARYSALKRVWDSLDDDDPRRTSVPDLEKAWGDVIERIDSDSEHLSGGSRDTARPVMWAGDRRAKPRSRSRRYTFVVSGAFIGIVILVSAIWQYPSTVQVSSGEQGTIRLADGSVIQMNSASLISYRRGFMTLPLVRAATRTVRLDGEAYFDVVHDAARPFIVRTPNSRIEVLGTRFNVRARPRGDAMETVVTLADGRLRVASGFAPSEPDGSIVLDSAGVSLVVHADRAPEHHPRPAPLERRLAWRNRGFAAVNEPVEYILREVEVRFALQITVQPGLELGTPMTVFYQRGTSPEEIIHDICLERGWHYRPSSRGYSVFEAPAGPAPHADINV